MKLISALPGSQRMISVVGGGGKTSFIFALAKEAAALGKSILILTTTAMFNPEYFEPEQIQPFDDIFIGPALDLTARPIIPGTILVAAPALTAQNRKLIGYSPGQLAPLLENPRFDLVLMEADGARMRPVKAPAGHEPVIPDQTDTMVGCIGLDCLGKPLDAPYVHRPEILANLTGQEVKTPITGQTLTRLIGSDRGLFKSAGPEMKKILILNKADTSARIDQARSIGEDIISRSLADTCLVTSFLDARSPVKITFTG